MEDPAATARRRSWLRQERRWFLEILTLTSFVVAQPVLDVFGRSPETFVFEEATRAHIVLFGLTMTLAPAVGLWLLAAAFRVLGPVGRKSAQDLMVGILLSLLAIQVLKRLTPLVNVPLTLAGILVGGLLLLGLQRARSLRRWLRFGWPAAPAFLAIFLLASPISSLVLPQPGSDAASAQTGSSDTPVVIAIFDQFPLQTILDEDGSINETLFPNLARLAAGSTWYRNYTVTESHTTFSIPVILTGRDAEDRERGSAVAANHPENLFTLLAPTHRMEVYTGSVDLCPFDPCATEAESEDAVSASAPRTLRTLIRQAASIWSDISLPRPVTRDVEAQFEEEVDPEPPPGSGARPDADRRRSRYDRLLASIQPGQPAAVHYTHILLPHYPWKRLPTGNRYTWRNEDLPLGQSAPRTWFNLGWPLELTRQRHLLQTQVVDSMIGRLIERLEETGLYDDALVVVTSDHGHSFTPGLPRAVPVDENLHDILWVPLLMKEPGQREGRVDDKNINAFDLVPTIADLLDVELPWPTDGTSALRDEADRGPVKTYLRRHDPPRIPMPDTTLSIPIEEAWKRLLSGVYRPADPGADPELLPYLVGPGGHLVGRSIDGMPVGTPTELSAILDEDDFEVDAEQPLVPALISGIVPGAPGDALIAVAVNGRIGGVSTVFDLHGREDRFIVLAPDFFLREGPNRVELFELRGEILHPMAAR